VARRPSLARALVVTVMVLYIIGVPMLLGVPRLAPLATTARQPAPAATRVFPISVYNGPRPAPIITPTQILRVDPGSAPGTIVIEFSGDQITATVAAVSTLYDLTVISGDAASGSYVFELPKIQVYPESAPSQVVWIAFPKIYSAEGINAFFAENQLTLMRWATDPETGQRFAAVQLPQLEAKLVDASRGYYTITLRPADDATLAAWARDSGVRIISYDAATGVTIVQPLDWRGRPPLFSPWGGTGWAHDGRHIPTR